MYSTVLPVAVYVSGFIWFLLLPRSLLMMCTFRRTGWVPVSQDSQHATGPTGKNNARKDTHGAILLWKNSMQLSAAMDAEWPWKEALLQWRFCLNWFYLSLYATISSLTPPFLIRARWGQEEVVEEVALSLQYVRYWWHHMLQLPVVLAGFWNLLLSIMVPL